MNRIRSLFALLLRALRLSSGRHGTGNGVACKHTELHADVPSVRPTVRVSGPVLRGEDVGHVRPYLVAFERQQKENRQRERRRALLLALDGIDVGPRVIHGVKVAV